MYYVSALIAITLEAFNRLGIQYVSSDVGARLTVRCVDAKMAAQLNHGVWFAASNISNSKGKSIDESASAFINTLNKQQGANFANLHQQRDAALEHRVWQSATHRPDLETLQAEVTRSKRAVFDGGVVRRYCIMAAHPPVSCHGVCHGFNQCREWGCARFFGESGQPRVTVRALLLMLLGSLSCECSELCGPTDDLHESFGV